MRLFRLVTLLVLAACALAGGAVARELTADEKGALADPATLAIVRQVYPSYAAEEFPAGTTEPVTQ